MNEKNDGMIDPNKLLVNRRNRSRKPLKPKTQARKNYEDGHPAISIRVEQGTKLQFLVDAKRNGLSEKDYLSLLINSSHLNIEKIRNEAFADGQKSMESQFKQKCQSCPQARATADVEKIRRDATLEAERRTAIYVWCANRDYGCHNMIPIERDTELAKIAVNAIFQQQRFLCLKCQWRVIVTKPDEPPPEPFRRSWLP
jgi:hypothetical protein